MYFTCQGTVVTKTKTIEGECFLEINLDQLVKSKLPEDPIFKYINQMHKSEHIYKL
jgi:hypothetical protein